MSNIARVVDIAQHFHSQTDPRLHEETGPIVITEGDGVRVRDDAGNSYIEGMSGLWCASLGFNNDRLADVAHRQMRRLATYHTFNHRSNDACIDLVEQIDQILPFRNGHVFLVNSGSEAIDTMVKLAWFYQIARGQPEKRKIISRTGAFHGSTVMGAALSGLPQMHASFNLPGMNVVFTERAHFYRDGQPGETEEQYAARLADSLETLILHEGAETIAAMIAEPVNGAGGVVVPPKGYFPLVQSICRKYGILLLADEVICGFGRTGRWFGSETFGFEPDMMSVAKGLSSGYLPIAGAIIRDEIYQPIADEAHRLGVFGHGFTYSGHPVTAAVAAEAIRIYREMDVPQRARMLGEALDGALRRSLADHPLVGEVRSTGFMAGIELVADRHAKSFFDPAAKIGARVERRCRAHGVMIRNMGDVLAICPPFIMETDEVAALVDGIRQALDDVAADLALTAGTGAP